MRKPIQTSTGLCYIGGKPRGPVLENTISVEVATPTVKRGFVSSKFKAVLRLARRQMVSGGMGLPARMAARLRTCFQHPVHPLCLKTQKVGSLIPVGTQTMTVITAANSATTPTTGTPDPIQLHAQAHNALNMAVFYLRQPQANTAAARRKAVQALAALRDLSATLEG